MRENLGVQSENAHLIQVFIRLASSGSAAVVGTALSVTAAAYRSPPAAVDSEAVIVGSLMVTSGFAMRSLMTRARGARLTACI